jgi:hypothetical protein
MSADYRRAIRQVSSGRSWAGCDTPLGARIEELERAMDEMNGRWYSLASDPLLEDLRAHRAFRILWDDRLGRRRAAPSIS